MGLGALQSLVYYAMETSEDDDLSGSYAEGRETYISGIRSLSTPSKHRDSQLSDASRKKIMSAHDANALSPCKICVRTCAL